MTCSGCGGAAVRDIGGAGYGRHGCLLFALQPLHPAKREDWRTLRAHADVDVLMRDLARDGEE